MAAVITDVPGSYGFAAKSFVDHLGNLLALVLAWSYLEPHRAGEVAMVPPGKPGTPVSWGRERNGQRGPERLGFSRCRPGLLPQSTCDIRDGAVSHVQLRVQALGRDALLIDKGKEAKAPIRLNGREGTSLERVAGDVLEIGGAVVLLCVPRPVMLVGSVPTTIFRSVRPTASGSWASRRPPGSCGARSRSWPRGPTPPSCSERAAPAEEARDREVAAMKAARRSGRVDGSPGEITPPRPVGAHPMGAHWAGPRTVGL
jgi:hypothetical protein